MTYRKLFYSLLTLALLVVATGCDSNGDDDSDADVFVGNWEVTKIEDDDGDQTALFQQVVSSFTASFEEDGTYDLLLDYNPTGEAAGNSDIQFTDNYTVNESTGTILLETPLGAPLLLDYDIVNNNQIVLSSSNAGVINLAFGTNYTGTAALTIERQ